MQTAKTVIAVVLRWAEQQRLLDFAAYHDPLTGVGNRKKFFDALKRSPAGGAILYCDLDYFKAVNDLHGHVAGDELLRLVARRIESCVRAGDVVARLGGDEFAVLCPGASPSRADEIASRIERALDDPFEIGEHRAHIGVSIGIGHALGSLGPETLEIADRNLYRVKGQRRPPRDSER
jgi:diguanylate cyclase (GGDEF)-like protein